MLYGRLYAYADHVFCNGTTSILIKLENYSPFIYLIINVFGNYQNFYSINIQTFCTLTYIIYQCITLKKSNFGTAIKNIIII